MNVFEKKNIIVMTFDLDWCEDTVLEYLLDKLIKNRVPATFFITHETKLLKKMKNIDYFELGIHPNFDTNSTHGKNFQEVVDYCLAIVPDAISSRPHGLMLSSNKLIYMMEKGIKIDCSIFMPNVGQLEPFYLCINANKILRVPYNWEDDYEFYQKEKKYRYQDIDVLSDKILDFHPIHVFLNSNSEEQYKLYKSGNSYQKNLNAGTETMLDDVIEKYIAGKIQIMNLKNYVGLK